MPISQRMLPHQGNLKAVLTEGKPVQYGPGHLRKASGLQGCRLIEQHSGDELSAQQQHSHKVQLPH